MQQQIVLPNIKKMFIPDPDYVMFDADLKGADAQVVAAEAEDEDLLAAFRAGLDVHNKNAEEMWGTAYTGLPGTIEAGPKYKKRKECKQGVHLTNYGGSAYAMARVLGWTQRESEAFQKRWFDIHPGIKKWHERVQRELDTTRTVTNKFGYRRVYFDRPDEILPEALAWVPQSTVALVSFNGAIQLERTFLQHITIEEYWRLCKLGLKVNDKLDVLLQVHDSIVFQVPRQYAHHTDIMRQRLLIPIPYPKPLTIQWGLARSEKSWGDCRSVD